MPVSIEKLHVDALLQHHKAKELASSLNAEEEEGWTYTAEPHGDTYSRILLTDESGSEVGYL